MRFFVTGVTGFIGKHLCRRLIAEGHHVVGLVRNPQKTTELPKNMEVLRGDLKSLATPDFVIPKCDIVIHLAGTITATHGSEYHDSNFQAVVDLHACLRRQSFRPRRLLFASSLAACGPSAFGQVLTEKSPPRPIDDYGRAKLKAEEFLSSQTDFPVTSFRPCTVIGPLDTNVFNLYKIARCGFGLVPAREAQPISFISVFDLIDAIVKMSQDNSLENKTYFVSHDTAIDTHSLWREVGNSMAKKTKLIRVPKALLYLAMQISTAYSRLFAKPNIFDRKYFDQLQAPGWVCSSEKLKQELAWTPKESFTEIVAKTAQSYRDAGWL